MGKNPRIILAVGSIVLALSGTAFYGLYQSREFLSGPRILIDEPENGANFAMPLMTLSGNAKNIAFLTLNGQRIFTDEQGRFTESLLLQKGYNIMTIEAKDRFGHTEIKKLELVYKPLEE